MNEIREINGQKVLFNTTDKRKNTFFEYPDYINMQDFFKDLVRKYREKNAFVIKTDNIEMKKRYVNKYPYEDKTKYLSIRYDEIYADALALAQKFLELGYKDKHIAIISKNRYEWMITYIACFFAGIVSVPLDRTLTQIEFNNLIKRGEVDVVVFDSAHIDMVNETLKLKENKLEKAILMDFEKDEKIFETVSKKEQEKYLFLHDLILEGEYTIKLGENDVSKTNIDPTALATIVFTSGTTAEPKGVMLSQKNLLSNISSMMRVEPIKFMNYNLAFLPYHHTFGSTGQLVMLAGGISSAFCDGLRHISTNLKEYGCDVFIGVPALIEGIYKKIWEGIEKQGKTKLVNNLIKFTKPLGKLGQVIRNLAFKSIHKEIGGLKFVITGASALDPDIQVGLRDMGITALQGYGLTESAPVIASENYKYKKRGTVGVELGCQVAIVNPDEENIGELIAKGDNIMLGYYKNPKATAETLKDGWLYTGDLASIDEQGYITISGRSKNMIALKNGKKIFPEELEDLINKEELVEESMVFGLEDSSSQDDVRVAVKIVTNEEIKKTDKFKDMTDEEIYDYLWQHVKDVNQVMPTYKYIKRLFVTDTPFEKTTTGKIKRFLEIDKINE